MRPPVYDYTKCSNCNKTAYISMLDAGLYYLVDTLWVCPYCKYVEDTVSLQENSDKNKE